MAQESSPETLAIELATGNRRALAKAITLIEGKRLDQRVAAADLLARLMPKTGGALRLGISGSPGVGKSTFIEAFGKVLLAQEKKLAILAIDPSSPLSGGSIMGDRTRMDELSSHKSVFIRPSPSGGALGGVARYTRETILACEAAGYDVVIIETVGVGQSEVLAASMVDCFLILQLPNAGDELQGIKKGILELADLIAITKADGEQKSAANRAKGELERALMYARTNAPSPTIHLTSSLAGSGLEEVWKATQAFVEEQKAQGRFAARRRTQAVQWYHDEVGEQLKEAAHARPTLLKRLQSLEADVVTGKLPASVAATRFVNEALDRSG